MEDLKCSASSALLSDFVFVTREFGSTKYSPEASCIKLGSNIERFAGGLPSAFLNGVIHTTPECTVISPELISEQIKYFSEAATPHIWWLTSLEQKEKIGPLLEKQGYVSGGIHQGFAATMDVVSQIQPPKLPKDTKIKIHEVKSLEEFSLFCQTFAEVFGFNEAVQNQYKKFLADFGENKVYRHLYATIDSKVVGVMSAFFRNGWCGAWNGGALIEARGQGVGRALGNALLELGMEEKVNGFSGILMAEANAKPLAVKLGGKKVCEFFPYLYGVASENFEPK
ncbi:MAG: hypothetical protein S4CHLAM6_10940 [Chlamydiae bacterium]|nr:hypothetical protein [Chlamydiota bacterium]